MLLLKIYFRLSYLIFLLLFALQSQSAGSITQWDCADTIRLTNDTVPQTLLRQSFGIDKDDRLYLIYNDPDSAVFMTKDVDSAWVFRQKLPKISTMAVDPVRKVVHILFVDDRLNVDWPVISSSGNLYYGNDSTEIFQFEEIDSGYFINLDLAIDSVGHPHISWWQSSPSSPDMGYIYYMVETDTVWEKQLVDSTEALKYGFGDPFLGVQLNGVAHILTGRVDSTSWGVLHLINDSFASKTWVKDETFIKDTFALPTDLYVDGDDNLHSIVLFIPPEPDPWLKYYFRSKDSASWNQPKWVAYAGGHSIVQVDTSGKAVVLYHDILGLNPIGDHHIGFAAEANYFSDVRLIERAGDFPNFVMGSRNRGQLIYLSTEGYLYTPVDLYHFGNHINLYQYKVSDLIKLINYLFKHGPEPFCPSRYDTNCSSTLSPSDLVILINYLFKNGPYPECKM